jgi:hypothetical protein
MHDAYNFILVDHLAFTMGVGGFLLGLVTGSPRRRRKSKPGPVEVYEYYGIDRQFADESNVIKKLRIDRTFALLSDTNNASRSGR